MEVDYERHFQHHVAGLAWEGAMIDVNSVERHVRWAGRFNTGLYNIYTFIPQLFLQSRWP